MKQDKSFQFVKRWRALEQQAKDLDWAKTAFAKDLRAEFDTGKLGDKALIKWCEIELGLPGYVAAELILRATVASVIGDKERYTRVGGFSSSRQLVNLQKSQQIQVLQAALAADKSIRSTMRDLGLVEEAAHEPTDAQLLAEYLHDLETSKAVRLPGNVKKIVNKYVVTRLSKAA